MNSHDITMQKIPKLIPHFLYPFSHVWYLNALVTAAMLSVLAALFPAVDARFMSGSEAEIQGNPPPSSSCTYVGRTSGTVTLCIANPLHNSTVSGLVTVQAILTGPQVDTRRAKLIFKLDEEYVLTDYLFPYQFELPTDHFSNGTKTLSVTAELNDTTMTGSASIDLRIDNSSSSASNQPAPFTPYSASAPVNGQPFIVAATGDGASGESSAVPDLIASWNPGMFLYLGDVYEDGTYTEFYNWYGSGSNYFSRFRSITNPTIGNHEYTNGKAPGYFEYWNNPPQYYSFDTAGWHFISLDSNAARQMLPGSAQYAWLARDLAKNTSQCTLAYFHEPLFTVGSEGGTPRTASFWSLLHRYQADLILTGHDHNYQRWMPLDSSGKPDLEGLTQFIVGTGGHGIRPIVKNDPRMVKGIDDVQEAVGALRLKLYGDRAVFDYINVKGAVLDSGEIPCHKAITNFSFHVPGSSTANMRDCPASSCKLVTSLSSGTEVTVLNQVTGQLVRGSAVWFEVSVGDFQGYVHSSLLDRIRQQS